MKIKYLLYFVIIYFNHILAGFNHSSKSSFVLVLSLRHLEYHKRKKEDFNKKCGHQSKRGRVWFSLKDCSHKYCLSVLPECMTMPEDGFEPNNILRSRRSVKCSSCKPRYNTNDFHKSDMHMFFNTTIAKGSVKGGGFVFN